MSIRDANKGNTYIIQDINTTDDNMKTFLLRLGCFSGEMVTVISKKKSGLVIAIKDGRYSIDNELASAIMV